MKARAKWYLQLFHPEILWMQEWSPGERESEMVLFLLNFTYIFSTLEGEFMDVLSNVFTWFISREL